MKVLVADDERIPRLVITKALTEWGYEVQAVTNGDEAWQILESDTGPRLAILDWMMPGMDGIEVCRRLRAQPTSGYTYVIILTARDEKADLVAALDAGADDYVAKPFNPQELRLRLRAGRRVVEFEDALRRQALHDPLTGILNHGAITDVFRRELARAARSGQPTGLAMIDADHFKRINDTYGHPVGDAVLREISRRLHNQLRASDAIGRYGGEEFLAVLSDCNGSAIRTVCERLRTIVSSSPICVGSLELTVTVSIGGAVATTPPNVAEESILQADRALYRAKRAGRNRVEIAE